MICGLKYEGLNKYVVLLGFTHIYADCTTQLIIARFKLLSMEWQYFVVTPKDCLDHNERQKNAAVTREDIKH